MSLLVYIIFFPKMQQMESSRPNTRRLTAAWLFTQILDSAFYIFFRCFILGRLSLISWLPWKCASQMPTSNSAWRTESKPRTHTGFRVLYLRALLYLLTAAFQFWFLKRLFPIFFTSSATDRTLSTWKEKKIKWHWWGLNLFFSF